jgi:hypothetical protein
MVWKVSLYQRAFRREDFMSALVRHLGIVSESKKVGVGDLMRISAALQKQAVRDLGPIWQVSATVDAFAKLDDVPDGYWPMIIRDDIKTPGAAGVHEDDDGQPFALIAAGANLDNLSLTASHEMLEMLVDPFGNRQVTGDSPKRGQGRVSFLVEVCDPSEAAEFAYSVNGILVSDFYTPHYFDPIAASSVRYSFTGKIKKPREILRGGYLSWKDPVSGHWWQQTWFKGTAPEFRDLGKLTSKAESLRSMIDRVTEKDTAKAIAPGRKKSDFAGKTAQVGYRSSESNAVAWRGRIGAILRRRGA